MVDTHIHLYSDEYKGDLQSIIKRASIEGVNKFFMPNLDIQSLPQLLSIEQQYPQCYSMIGLHPCYVKDDFKTQLDFLYNQIKVYNFKAVGEIGLDYYWDLTYQQEQISAFETQLFWAAENQLPVIIHCRNSTQDAINIVKKHKTDTGIFHCFSGTLEEARQIIDMNFYLGIGGVVTFKNGGLDKVLPFIELDKLVLETDGPYLAPVPYRGKRNEPAYLIDIVKKIADIKNKSVAEVIDITTNNANKIFKVV